MRTILPFRAKVLAEESGWGVATLIGATETCYGVGQLIGSTFMGRVSDMLGRARCSPVCFLRVKNTRHHRVVPTHPPPPRYATIQVAGRCCS